MRTLFVGALAATVVGCSCYVSPQTGFEACANGAGNWFACSDRTSFSQTTELEPASLDAGPAKQRTKSRIAARTDKPPSARSTDKIARATPTAKPAASATQADPAQVDSPQLDPPQTDRPRAASPSESSDPILAKAKVMVAAKLEDPASAEFGEIRRAVRTNMLGQSVDTVCGHVKGKKPSGEATGDRPFLFLVKDSEAYVVDGPPTSIAATAYRNICN
jgi:hypothetical protein